MQKRERKRERMREEEERAVRFAAVCRGTKERESIRWCVSASPPVHARQNKKSTRGTSVERGQGGKANNIKRVRVRKKTGERRERERDRQASKQHPRSRSCRETAYNSLLRFPSPSFSRSRRAPFSSHRLCIPSSCNKTIPLDQFTPSRSATAHDGSSGPSVHSR